MQYIECNGTAAITRSRHQKSFSCYVYKHLLHQHICRQSFYVLMTSAVNGISQLCVLKTEFYCTNTSVLCNCRLPPRCEWGPCCSGILHSVYW